MINKSIISKVCDVSCVSACERRPGPVFVMIPAGRSPPFFWIGALEASLQWTCVESLRSSYFQRTLIVLATYFKYLQCADTERSRFGIKCLIWVKRPFKRWEMAVLSHTVLVLWCEMIWVLEINTKCLSKFNVKLETWCDFSGFSFQTLSFFAYNELLVLTRSIRRLYADLRVSTSGAAADLGRLLWSLFSFRSVYIVCIWWESNRARKLKTIVTARLIRVLV